MDHTQHAGRAERAGNAAPSSPATIQFFRPGAGVHDAFGVLHDDGTFSAVRDPRGDVDDMVAEIVKASGAVPKTSHEAEVVALKNTIASHTDVIRDLDRQLAEANRLADDRGLEAAALAAGAEQSKTVANALLSDELRKSRRALLTIAAGYAGHHCSTSLIVAAALNIPFPIQSTDLHRLSMEMRSGVDLHRLITSGKPQHGGQS